MASAVLREATHDGLPTYPAVGVPQAFAAARLRRVRLCLRSEQVEGNDARSPSTCSSRTPPGWGAENTLCCCDERARGGGGIRRTNASACCGRRDHVRR